METNHQVHDFSHVNLHNTSHERIMQQYQNLYTDTSVSNHHAITGMYKLHMHITLYHNVNHFTLPVSSQTNISLHDLTKTLTTHEHYTLLELDVA
jgi:hypothetical protein